MPGVSPLSPKNLKPFDFFFDLVKRTMGFVPNSMKTMAREPAILGGFSSLAGMLLADPNKSSPLTILKLQWKNLFWAAKFAKDPNRIPVYLRQLTAHVSSVASGCQYCQAHTLKSAHMAGVSDEKLQDLWSFETSTHFDEKEKAALRFGIASGSSPNAVTPEHFVDLRKHYNENQIVELGAVVALFGFLNRWNDTFATELEAEPIAMAEKLMAGEGWKVGKHK